MTVLAKYSYQQAENRGNKMIILPLPPSVNSAYGQAGGRQRFKSKKYRDWLASCPKLFHSYIEAPVELTYKFYIKP